MHTFKRLTPEENAAQRELYQQFNAAFMPLYTANYAALKTRGGTGAGMLAIIAEADLPPGARSLVNSIESLAKRQTLAELRKTHPQFFSEEDETTGDQ